MPADRQPQEAGKRAVANIVGPGFSDLQLNRGDAQIGRGRVGIGVGSTSIRGASHVNTILVGASCTVGPPEI